MALKYPNKCKRAGYWSVYEQAGINDLRLVFEEICDILQEVPEEKEGRGRPPNLSQRDLYRMFVFFTAFPLTLRQLESYTWLLLKKELDHTNWSRWICRLDEQIVSEATAELNRRMTARRNVEDIADSTPFTLSFYRALMRGWEMILE